MKIGGVLLNDGTFRIKLGRYISFLKMGNKVMLDHRYTRAISNWQWPRKYGTFELLPDSEPNPHILIVGMSGYGKSTLCKQLIMEVAHAGKKIMVFDVHNEHSDVVRTLGGKDYDVARVGINIMALDGVSVEERIGELVGLLSEAYHLGNIQEHLLKECMWYTYKRLGAYSHKSVRLDKTPMIADLMDELAIFIRHTKLPTERKSLLSLRSKLSTLNTNAFNGNFVTLEQLKGSISSFSLAGLRNREARTIYINELLKRLYLSMKENAREEGVKYYILLDETQFLIGTGNLAGELIRKTIEEGRKYGVGLIIATHSASNLHKQIVANASTFITFHSTEPEEIEYVSDLLSFGRRDAAEEIKNAMANLGQHEALVIKAGMGAPAMIATRTAMEIHREIRFPETELGQEKAREDYMLEFTRGPVKKETLDEKFGSKWQRMTDRLIADGKMGKVIFHKKDGDEVWYAARFGSVTPEHEICVRKIADVLREKGIECETLTAGGTPKPDIKAFVNGSKLAIEYETGRKKQGPDGIREIKEMLSKRTDYFAVVMFVNERFEWYKTNFSSNKVVVLQMADLENFAATLAKTGEINIYNPPNPSNQEADSNGKQADGGSEADKDRALAPVDGGGDSRGADKWWDTPDWRDDSQPAEPGADQRGVVRDK